MTNESGLDDLDPKSVTARDAVHFRRLIAARRAGDEAEVQAAVDAALAAGDSWLMIGSALSMTTDDARKLYG